MREPPIFYIYGVPPQAVDEEFVHVERVLDRIEVHQGRVEPHRHARLTQLSLWTEGQGDYLIEGRSTPLPPRALSIMPAGFVHGFDIDPPTNAIVLSIATGFPLDALGGDEVRALFQAPALLALDELEAERLEHLFAAAEDEYRFAGPLREQAITAYVQLILILAARLIARSGEGVALRGRSALLASFLNLVEQNLRARWPLGRYVEALGTTPYLLNAATKAGFGQTASDLLKARTVAEAKRLLLFTTGSVAEIAFALGFDDPAHFGRFFQGATGASPAAWRRRQAAPGASED